MKNRKVKQLVLAVGMALGGMGLIPSAQAVNVSPNNLGQALIFPYYTVQGNWQTLFGVTNTSSLVVAVKVRFREAYNSRDVFDFNLILSPFDTWTGWVSQDASGQPAIFSTDVSCTAPYAITTSGTVFDNGGTISNGTLSYTGDQVDGGPITTARMNEGYVEMIMMGAAQVVTPALNPDLTPLARGAIHVKGATPTGCDALRNAFTDETGTGLAALRLEFASYQTDPNNNALPLNPLKGSFSLVNGPLGLNAGGLPVHLANFSTGASAINGSSLVTSMQPQANLATGLFEDSYHEPSLFASDVAGEYITNAGGALSAAVYALPVTDALATTNIINEWTRRTDAAAGWVTATDWVITFPTKNFYVDNDPNNEFAGRNNAGGGGRGNGVVAPGLTTATLTPFSQSFVDTAATPVVRRGKSCDSVSYTMRDREEQRSVAGTFSPGGIAQLCNEVNVLTFNTGNILNSAMSSSVNYSESYLYGWLNVRFSGANAASGLPAVGFAIISRDDQNSGLLSEAALYNHSTVRSQ